MNCLKKEIKKVPLIYPLPIALLGVENNENIYYTTVSNVSIMAESPPIIGVMVASTRVIRKHLEVGQRISLNFPSTLMIDKADLCAHVSNDEFDKSTLFNTKFVLKAPYIDECPVVLIAEIIDHTPMQRQHFYTCSIKRTLIDEHLSVDENIPSMNILDPIIYGLDGKYYQIGKVIGKASLEGKLLYRNVRKKLGPQPYSFHFKHKLCRLKEEGWTYKDLAEKYNVYHETIEDWYALYSMYGKEGLTKKMANKLAGSRFTIEEKRQIAEAIIAGERTYREQCLEHSVSLSRLKNWVKKARRNQL